MEIYSAFIFKLRQTQISNYTKFSTELINYIHLTVEDEYNWEI